jgi:hypothetical protein
VKVGFVVAQYEVGLCLSVKVGFVVAQCESGLFCWGTV